MIRYTAADPMRVALTRHDALIRRALAQTHGNVSAAARLLGVTRDYVRYRLKEERADPEIGER